MKFKYLLFILILIIIFFENVLFSQWTWEVRLSPPSALQYVSVLDTGTLWAIGFKGFNNQDSPYVALRKPGIQWVIKGIDDMDLPNGSYTCIAAINDSSALVGATNGKVYLTTNSGLNWVLKIDAGFQAYVNEIKFSRSNKKYGYVFCDPPAGPGTDFKIYKTTDGGYNWSVMSPNFGAGFVGAALSTCVTDSNHAWYGLYCLSGGCNATKLAFTTNGGLNWNTSNMSLNSQIFTSVAFKSDNLNGLSCYLFDGAQGNINLFRTTNGGSNWNLQQNFYNPGYSIYSIMWIPETTDWYFTSGPTNPSGSYIFKSRNDGIAWDTMSRDNTWDQITSIDAYKFDSKIYGWAVSFNGYVYKMVDTAEIIGIHNSNNNFPTSYELYQNYPNPFNPVTNIKYDLPKSSFVSIKVYDILGHEVSTLVNEQKIAGSYEINFDGSNMASGLYFYRIEANKFIQSKKMILVK